MRKTTLAIFLTMAFGVAHGQVQFPYVLSPTNSPVGNACAQSPQLQTTYSNGHVYACDNGLVVDVTGSGGSLPTATAAGQIITSSGAGTTYAVQGQIFYSQSGDTISSIEAECSSLCTYHVTIPQTFTLGASHVLSSNVQLVFDAGGLWTVNGAFTLTLNSGVIASKLQQIFAGTSSIVVNNQNTYWEWWGAVNDGVYSASPTGTDNTTAIGLARAGTSSKFCFLPGRAGFYRITGPIAIVSTGSRCIGDATTSALMSDAFTITAGLVPVLMNTSTTANSITVTGSIGTLLDTPVVQNIAVAYPNKVTAGGTATCEFDQFTEQMKIYNFGCLDPNIGIHHIVANVVNSTYNNVAWGYGVATAYDNTYTGLLGEWFDSTANTASLSAIVSTNYYSVATSVSSNGQIAGGFLSSGQALNDIQLSYINTAGLQFPIEFNYLGGGTTNASNDIHVTHSILQCGGTGASNGIFLNGLAAAQASQITLDEGWVAACTIGVNIVGSSNVEISAMQLKANSTAFTASGSTSIHGTANIFAGASATDGALITNSSGVNVVFTLNTISTSAVFTNGVHLTSTATNNNITANCNGKGTNCVTADSTSYLNICTVSRAGGNWANRNSGIACNENLAVPDILVGAEQVTNGTVGANMLGPIYNSAANNNMPFGCVQIVGQQGYCVLNAYYDGTNWRYLNARPAMKFGGLFNSSSTAGFTVEFITNGSAGGIITWPATPAISCIGGGSCTFGLPVVASAIQPSGKFVASGQTAATTAQTLVTTTTTSTYQVNAVVTCDTTVAAATVTLTVAYTDPSSTAQTVTPSAAACTALGASSSANVTQTIRAKTGTTITVAAAISGSPNYDIAATALQITSN